MKYILVLCFISLVSIGKGQVPPHGGMPYPDPMQPIPRDTTKYDIPLNFMRGNIQAAYTFFLDGMYYHREYIKDSTPNFNDIVFLMQQNMELSQRLDRLEKKIDSLERRPIIYIDNLQKELWVKCPDGNCDIFIRRL